MNEFWAALVGAVVGSLVSGIISYCLQRAAFSEQRRDRKEREESERRALGHSLFLKLLSITNTLTHIRKHVEECQGRVAALGYQSVPPITYLLPILNIGDPVQVDAAEMTMLFSTGADDVFNAVVDLPNIHNSILPAWERYGAMRAELNEISSISINLSTGVGQTEFSEASPAAVKFFEANQVADQLIDRAVRDEREASEVLKLVVQVLNNKAGAGIKIEPAPTAKASEVD